MSRAEAWLRRIVEQGVEPNAICYNVVIHACVRGGHRDRAVQWIDRMAARGLVPTVNTYSVVLDGLAKEGDMDGADCGWRTHMDGDWLHS